METRRPAQKLMQATTRILADAELRFSCAAYALYATELSWPVLPPRMRTSIFGLNDRMSHFDPSASADEHLLGDIAIVWDLCCFVANTLSPEYLQVCVNLQNAEASILEKMGSSDSSGSCGSHAA